MAVFVRLQCRNKKKDLMLNFVAFLFPINNIFPNPLFIRYRNWNNIVYSSSRFAKTQRRDLLVFDSVCHLPTSLPLTVEASHCSFIAERQAVKFYKLILLMFI